MPGPGKNLSNLMDAQSIPETIGDEAHVEPPPVKQEAPSIPNFATSSDDLLSNNNEQQNEKVKDISTSNDADGLIDTGASGGNGALTTGIETAEHLSHPDIEVDTDVRIYALKSR